MYSVTSPPPQDHHRALGIVLQQGLRGGQFLISEAPLYTAGASGRADAATDDSHEGDTLPYDVELIGINLKF